MSEEFICEHLLQLGARALQSLKLPLLSGRCTGRRTLGCRATAQEMKRTASDTKFCTLEL
jgi:hypothetical protein